jgi:hypothetical protein
MNESMNASPSAGPEAGFNAATANQAGFNTEFAAMMGGFDAATAHDPFAPVELSRTEHGDIIPEAAQTPLTEAEIDAMFSSDQMDFTADDQTFLEDGFSASDQAFLEANGIAARVQTAEEQHTEQMRRMAFSIGQIVTDASANLLLAENDDEDGDDDVFAGLKVTARVPAHN